MVLPRITSDYSPLLADTVGEVSCQRRLWRFEEFSFELEGSWDMVNGAWNRSAEESISNKLAKKIKQSISALKP